MPALELGDEENKNIWKNIFLPVTHAITFVKKKSCYLSIRFMFRMNDHTPGADNSAIIDDLVYSMAGLRGSVIVFCFCLLLYDGFCDQFVVIMVCIGMVIP